VSIDLHVEPVEDEILEGELLDDDDPGPRPAERDPWWRRQLDHVPAGLRVLATERAAWLFVTEDHMTDRGVALSILNERHRVWEQARSAEHTTLAGRAKQQLAAANTSGSAAQAQGITPAGHTAAKRAELAARTAAAQWEQKAAAVLALTYTGHAPVTPSEIGDHRRRMSHRRRIRLALMVLSTYGLPGLLSGLPALTVEGAATGAAVALAAWGKSIVPQWRSGRRAEPDLAYPLPDGAQLIAPPGQPAASAAVGGQADPAAGAAGAASPSPPTGDPYPIRQAQSVQQAAECIHLALLAENLAVGQVTDVTQERWGWRAIAHLTKGKPADLVAKVANLDVLLGVRQGGVMPQPQQAAAGSVVLRIITSDPFDPMPPHPVHPPRSNSILKPMVLGPSMDGEPTKITLAGQNVMVIAVPGGGKSMIVRAMADYITSCTDAIVIDIDPTGRGLGPLRRLAAMRAYTEEAIDDALDWAIREAELRTQQMGDDVDNFQVDDENPAVFVIVDEHPQLTNKQKQKVIRLGRIGRKARDTVILLSQDATSEVVGDAIADVFGIRIMLPCRKADVPLVVGSDTAISEGWMPHRLTPSPGDWDPADAGTFYVLAPGLRDPILRHATHLDAATATLRANERLAADPASTSAGPPAGASAVDFTKPAAAEEATEEDWEILTATAEAFGEQLNVLCRQVAEALQAQDEERWADANATTVGEVFRRAGVFRRTVRVSGLQPSTGAALEDIRALLKDRAV